MASDHERYASTRRDFLKLVGGGAGVLLSAGTGYAHHHGKPMPQSLPYLDQQTYTSNMEIVARLPGNDRANRSAGPIMAIGSNRYMISSGDMLDITDPLNVKIAQRGGVPGGELAYHAQAKKWMIMQSVQAPHDFYNMPFGKYEDAAAIKAFRVNKEFRGVRMWDASDPSNVVRVSELNTGPTGFGVHGDQCYWDGGKYAYIAASSDDSFTGMLSCIWPQAVYLMVLDVSDPASVTKVSEWWVPGMKNTEVAQLKRWKCVAGRADALPEDVMTMEESIEAFKEYVVPNYPAPDRLPFTALHGPVSVPTRVENGGTLAYGSWSNFGMLIHDLSDITRPQLIGTFDPSPTYGWEAIPFHTIWMGTLPRGFVVGISESLNPDCNEEYLPNWVIDVRDPRNPVPIATLERPKAPPEAPFTDFCQRRGRFSAHKPPYLASPGRMSQTFLPVEYFNAGIRCYDLSEPTQPKEVGYFVPPMGGTLSPECRVPTADLQGADKEHCAEESLGFVRPCNSIAVEWDRNVMYAGTTTGLYVLTSPALGKPNFSAMPVTEWALPDVNIGAPV